MQFETKDCLELTEDELQAMSDLCEAASEPVSQEFLETEKDRWVLAALGYENERLKGFSFFTLDRIGGTPSIVSGFSAVACYSKRRTVMRGLTAEQFKRAFISFPEEDVLVGACFQEADCYEVFWKLEDVVPRPGYDANGEDRAWGTRLAKRFGIEDSSYSRRDFRIKGCSETAPVWRYTEAAAKSGPPKSSQPKSSSSKTSPAKQNGANGNFAGLFEKVKSDRGDCLIVHGWVRKEDLVKFSS